jgi:hypothetical protein
MNGFNLMATDQDILIDGFPSGAVICDLFRINLQAFGFVS